MSTAGLAYIALGSNLGESRAILESAFQELEKLSTAQLVRSSLWETSPVDCPPGSPLFLNAVAALRPLPEESPETLLEKLQELERHFGRRPKVVMNEARPLDLDLIAFGEAKRSSPELHLPHPRAHLRKFVLAPLAEIAPDLLLPGQTDSVAKLLEHLQSPEEIHLVR